MAYIIITNKGDYYETTERTEEGANVYMHCLFSNEEIKELEAEVIEE